MAAHFTCDRCGAGIETGERTALKPRVGTLRGRRSETDLCQPCHDLLEAWLAREDRPRSGAMKLPPSPVGGRRH
jgi:hypothetical protein